MSEKEVTYKSFMKDGKGLYVPKSSDISEAPRLPPGVYDVFQDSKGELYFKSSKITHDNLVDLPDTVYDQVVKEIKIFLAPETRQAYDSYGFIYKRSSLLFGKPGTGKTCIVNKVAREVVEKVRGVVIFNPNPDTLSKALEVLDDVQPETTIMVIFEELDELLKRYESNLLNLLDGEVQKENIIYMATTNHVDRIPDRIRRPGRFSSVLEVVFPTDVARLLYLKSKKITDSEELDSLVKATEGYSIDELKELVLSIKCLGYTTEDALARISKNKGSLIEAAEYEDPEDREGALAYEQLGGKSGW